MAFAALRTRLLFSLLLSSTCLTAIASPGAATTYVVRLDGSGDFTTIQAAIDACIDGDTVVVADGTYGGSGNQDLDFGGRDITVRSENGPVNCILGPVFGRGAYFHSGETNAAVLQGFTVAGGQTLSGYGGGILCDGAWPTIADMVIDDCLASDGGGGIAVLNTSTHHVVLSNNLVVRNQSQDDGGGIYVRYGMLRMKNNTVDGNRAVRGGGLYFGSYTSVDITDNIFWGNWVTGIDTSTMQLGGPFGGNFSYNLVEGTTGLPPSNFDGNPRFVSGPMGDRYLNPSTSDAVDAGSGAATATCVPTADGTICMSLLTTATTGARDTGTVDVGYHYGLGVEELHVPSGFTTIQNAVDVAVDGDIVLIAPGTYLGAGNRDVDLLGKAITVASSTGDPSTCTLDPQGSSSDPHRAFLVRAGEGPDTVIAGLTITGAHNDNGGGILVNGTSPTIEDCVFSSITGNDGGAILVAGGGNPTIRRCVFRDNDASDAGGAVCVSYSGATIADCRFENNYARWGGGAVYFLDSIGNVSDSIFTGNVCDAWGGGIHVTRAGNHVLAVRCTFDGNQAPQGAQIYARVDASIDVQNSILSSGVTGSAVYATTGGSAWLTCSDVWNNAGGDWVDGIAGQQGNPGNFSADPLYCYAVGGDFTVSDDSPCAASHDPVCGQIGALGVGCSSGPRTYVVLPDGSGDLPTIQAAIDACSDGDTVRLGGGIFTGAGNRDLDYAGRAITVRGQSTGAPSVIDCQGLPGDDHRGFWFGTGEGAASVLEYVTITGGHAWDGGAVAITSGSSPTLRDCRFVGNTSTDDGGGVFYSHGAGARLVRCEIADNAAADRGGGVYAHASVAAMEDCIVRGNTTVNYGGGIYTHEGGSVDLVDCLVSENTATGGGGIFIQGPASSALLRVRFERNVASGSGGGLQERNDSVTSFDHCSFVENEADLGGGVYNVFQCRPTFTNCTFVENTATTRGGALRIYTGASVTLERCLLWSDHCGLGPEIAISSSCTLSVNCSDIQGGSSAIDDYDHSSLIQWDASNIDSFPCFCDLAAGELTLVDATSPCLPSGNSCGVLIGAYGAGCTPPTGVDDGPVSIASTWLGPARPNPFNPRTEIQFSLAETGPARLAVYDTRGRLIRVLSEGVLMAGTRSVWWDGRDDRGRAVGTAVYLFRLDTRDRSLTGKATLLK